MPRESGAPSNRKRLLLVDGPAITGSSAFADDDNGGMMTTEGHRLDSLVGRDVMPGVLPLVPRREFGDK